MADSSLRLTEANWSRVNGQLKVLELVESGHNLSQRVLWEKPVLENRRSC